MFRTTIESSVAPLLPNYRILSLKTRPMTLTRGPSTSPKTRVVIDTEIVTGKVNASLQSYEVPCPPPVVTVTRKVRMTAIGIRTSVQTNAPPTDRTNRSLSNIPRQPLRLTNLIVPLAVPARKKSALTAPMNGQQTKAFTSKTAGSKNRQGASPPLCCRPPVGNIPELLLPTIYIFLK